MSRACMLSLTLIALSGCVRAPQDPARERPSAFCEAVRGQNVGMLAERALGRTSFNGWVSDGTRNDHREGRAWVVHYESGTDLNVVTGEPEALVPALRRAVDSLAAAGHVAVLGRVAGRDHFSLAYQAGRRAGTLEVRGWPGDPSEKRVGNYRVRLTLDERPAAAGSRATSR
ncbi:MAG: hypothetical protein HZC42_07850 [Candidatus Eisenbacteria bacterium]|nr:hypothetical protein [Candidatus Eisenbacteria bacterium]